MRRILGCLALCLLGLPLTAAAQPAAAEGRGFISVFFGAQAGDGASTQRGEFSIYDETGSFEAAQEFDGGGLLWIGGGARVWGNVGVGAAYSRFSVDQDATVSVTAPHPLIFGAPRSTSAAQGDLTHAENAFHLQLLYIVPVNERFEVVLGGGPSFIAVTHDVVTGAGFTETGAPYTTITVANVAVTEADKMVTGFNIGAEAAYYVTQNVGVGGFVRWVGGSADLEAGNQTIDLDVGGAQFGAGVRIRF